MTWFNKSKLMFWLLRWVKYYWMIASRGWLWCLYKLLNTVTRCEFWLASLRRSKCHCSYCNCLWLVRTRRELNLRISGCSISHIKRTLTCYRCCYLYRTQQGHCDLKVCKQSHVWGTSSFDARLNGLAHSGGTVLLHCNC